MTYLVFVPNDRRYPHAVCEVLEHLLDRGRPFVRVRFPAGHEDVLPLSAFRDPSLGGSRRKPGKPI